MAHNVNYLDQRTYTSRTLAFCGGPQTKRGTGAGRLHFLLHPPSPPPPGLCTMAPFHLPSHSTPSQKPSVSSTSASWSEISATHPAEWLCTTITIVCHHVTRLRMDNTGAVGVVLPELCNVFFVTDDTDATAPARHSNALAMSDSHDLTPRRWYRHCHHVCYCTHYPIRHCIRF